MGVFKMFSRSSFDNGQTISVLTDLSNYNILGSIIINNKLIVKIKYTDCSSYEGRKILVFENCSFQELINQKIIDPHFSENKKYHSPIARFKPDKEGWNNACIFAEC